MTLLFLQAFVV